VIVAAVANIPGSPSDGDAIEVTDATGIESFTPLAGIPAGFTGDSGLSVRIVYSSAGSTWNWVQYFPNNPDARYPLQGELGTAASPAYYFDANTGIYSPGADQVAISTNGTGRLFVDASGNISLGQASSALQSGGTGLTIYGASASEIKFLNSTTGSAATDGTALVANSNDFTINNREAGSILFGTSNTERLRITSDGKLGVATSSPTYKLEVGTTSDAVNHISIKSSTTGSAHYYFSDTNNGQAGISYDHSTDVLTIRSNDAAAITVDSSQRVGIGTTSVGAKLHVVGGNAGNCLIDNDGSQFTQLLLQRNSTANTGGDLLVNGTAGEFQIRSLVGPLCFHTSSPAGTNSERLRITSDGKLGLGSSSPQTLFELAGNGTAIVRATNSNPGMTDDTLIGGYEFYKTDASGNGAGVVGAVRMRSGDSVGASAYMTLSTSASSGGNDIERVRITSGGLVGIGATVPSDKLHIDGGSIRITGSNPQYIQAVGINLNLNTDNQNILFSRGGTEMARFDSSSRFLVGTSSSSIESTLKVQGNSSSSLTDAVLVLCRGNTSPSDNQFLGSVSFADSSELFSARIICHRDGGTWGASSKPGRLAFYTTADGASSPTERMRIDSSGQVGIGVTTLVGGTSDVSIIRNSAIRWADSDGTQRVDIYGDSSSNFVVRNGTGSTERARIDSSGRLLVGTSSSPSAGDGQYAKLVVQGYAGGTPGGGVVSIQRDEAATAISAGETLGFIGFGDSAGNTFASIIAAADAAAGSGDYPGRLAFYTTADGASSPTERMRITNVGFAKLLGDQGSPDSSTGAWHEFLSNQASARTGHFKNYNTSYTGQMLIISCNRTTTNGTYQLLYANNGNDTGVFKVLDSGNCQNTNNSYTGTSDLKLKQDIVDAGSQWDDIKALRVRKYRFKAKPEEHLQIGLVAQEIESICPGLVEETNNYDQDGTQLETTTKAVKYSVLYMKAVKALQEAMERIEVLEAKVNALEGD